MKFILFCVTLDLSDNLTEKCQIGPSWKTRVLCMILSEPNTRSFTAWVQYTINHLIVLYNLKASCWSCFGSRLFWLWLVSMYVSWRTLFTMKLDLLYSQALVLYPIRWHYTCLHRVTKKLSVNQVLFQWNILTFKRRILQISSIMALFLFVIQFLSIALADPFTTIVRIYFREVSNNFCAG